MIPVIDIKDLFGGPSPARDRTDRVIFEAASGIGFMTIAGFPGAELLTREKRAEILRIFSLPDAEKAKMLRWNFDPSNKNVYRGWFPLQQGMASHKEGIDMGPDVAHDAAPLDADDPLCEPTPLPPEALLPGWRQAAAAYYVAMENIGAGLMRSVARSLALPETAFDPAFAGGISTLRLTRYPVRPAPVEPADPRHVVVIDGKPRELIGGAHVDSGFVTLLAQDGVEGLQAQRHDGVWLDVPPAEGTLAVNFGSLLERWTGGMVKATRHRVVSPGRERFSIPFFYEPAADAEIAPLPIEGSGGFKPFLYGDYVWEAATSFVEQQGIRHLREPRRKAG